MRKERYMYQGLEVLYSAKEIVVLFDKDSNTVMYSYGSGSNHENFTLTSQLSYLQVFTKTGDLVICCADGSRRIYLRKPYLKLSLKDDFSNLINILNHEFIVSEGQKSIKAWAIKGKRLIPLNYAIDIIRVECMPPDQFGVINTKSKEKLLITSRSTYRIIQPECLIVEYPLKKAQEQCKQLPVDTTNDYGKTATNDSNSYIIQYSCNHSHFSLFHNATDSLKLLDKVEKHSCGLYQINFINDVQFLSLDSGGKIKIWLIEDDIPYVCQTLFPDELHLNSCYDSFNIDVDKQIVSFRIGKREDHYILHLKDYRKGKKNSLLQYVYSNEVVTENTETIRELQFEDTTEAIDNRPITKPVNNSHKTQTKGTEGEYYGSLFISAKSAEKIKLENAANQISNANTLEGGIPSLVVNISENIPDNRQSSDPEPYYNAKEEIEKTEIIRQTTNSRFRKRQAVIYVGIDFGTSRTKVSFNNESSGRYQPLCFESLHQYGYTSYDNVDRYAIPSIVSKVDPYLYYGFEAIGKGDMFQNIKQKLLKREELNSDLMYICAGFLAYVMKITMIKICETTDATPDDKFVFSVCLPVERMNRNPVKINFEKTLNLARELLIGECMHDLRRIKALSDKLNNLNNSISNIRTAIIPESIAEVLDFYTRKAKSKLYALYDFGAGTTDLTVFEYNRNTGKAEIIDAAIVYKGYSYIDGLKREGKDNRDIIQAYYQSIWRELLESDIWARVKRKRTGDESMRMFYNISIFGSGGGYNDKAIHEIFNKIPLYHERTKEYIVAQEGIQKLEEPRDWNPDYPPYFRFAVSFGLTRKPEETNKTYILPKDCKKRTTSYTKIKVAEPDVIYPSEDWFG